MIDIARQINAIGRQVATDTETATVTLSGATPPAVSMSGRPSPNRSGSALVPAADR